MGNYSAEWEEVCKRYDVLEKIEEKGYCDLRAEDIKQVKEPRLLAKHDNRSQRPDVFARNDLSILPLSRSLYRIGHMDLFQQFRPMHVDWSTANEGVIPIRKPDIESIDFNNIYSESNALNSLYVSHILEQFLGEEKLMPTVNGRMGTGNFDFRVQNVLHADQPYSIPVNNAQMEIDGGYEGLESLCLVEAKMNFADDFMVRQLYYPYRVWRERTNKTIRPVFMVFSNGIYHLMEYQFEDPTFYNSIRLVNYLKYTIVDDALITINDLIIASRQAHSIPEPPVPFPQANAFERVISLCEALAGRDEPITVDEIASMNGFTDRQSDYYGDAAAYLGLVRRCGPKQYILTDEGQRLFSRSTSIRMRNISLVQLMLCHDVYMDCFRFRLEHGGITSSDCEAIMRRHPECALTESLYARRATTVSYWIKWCFNLVCDVTF